jgi:hypothetical protein
MTQMETVWTEKSSLFDMVPADFVEMAKKRAGWRREVGWNLP